ARSIGHDAAAGVAHEAQLVHRPAVVRDNDRVGFARSVGRASCLASASAPAPATGVGEKGGEEAGGARPPGALGHFRRSIHSKTFPATISPTMSRRTIDCASMPR